jgi:hypothetical protein
MAQQTEPAINTLPPLPVLGSVSGETYRRFLGSSTHLLRNMKL